MRRNNFLTLALAMFLALGSIMAIAQVTVNAPEALMKRGGNKAATQAPAAPAATTPATTAPAAPAAAQPAGTAAAPGRVVTTRTPSSKQKKVVGQAPKSYVARGASFMPSAATTTTTAGVTNTPVPNTSSTANKRQTQMTGYRVQVMFSSEKDAREVARTRAKEVALRYPSYKCYISYVTPQWRLRFGDFKFRADANLVMSRLCRAFPKYRKDIIVVQDKINVR